MAKPLAHFRPSASSRPRSLGPPANHHAGFPGSGATVSSNPVTTPTGHLVTKMPIGMQHQVDPITTLPQVVNAKVGEKDNVGAKEGMGTPSLSALQSPQWVPLSSTPFRRCQRPPFQSPHGELNVLPANLRSSHMNTIKRPVHFSLNQMRPKSIKHRGFGCPREEAPAKSQGRALE